MMLQRLFLGSLLLATTTVSADEVVRFAFRFGFFEDDETPETDIMKEDIEGVLCQTQYFMSQLVQNATETKSVHAKAANYELMLQGSITPTLSEQAQFTTKEVRIAMDPFTCDVMLGTTSIVLDMCQGPDAELASDFRHFVKEFWKQEIIQKERILIN